MLQTLGKVTVPSAGTPVQLSTKTLNANSAYFQALSGNTGKMYVGLAGMIKTTLVNVLHVIVPPPASPLTLDSWDVVGITIGPIDFSQLWIDADTSTQGLLISYLVT